MSISHYFLYYIGSPYPAEETFLNCRSHSVLICPDMNWSHFTYSRMSNNAPVQLIPSPPGHPQNSDKGPTDHIGFSVILSDIILTSFLHYKW